MVKITKVQIAISVAVVVVAIIAYVLYSKSQQPPKPKSDWTNVPPVFQ